MKKILIIANTLNPNSGWGRHASSAVKGLEEIGFEISVLTENNYGENKNELNILNPLGHSKILNLIRNIVVARNTAKKFDVVHAFDGWPYGVYAYFATLGTGKRFFINGIGTYSVAPLDDKFKGFLLKKAYRKAHKIFCISNYTKNKILKKISLNNLKVVHMGSDELPVLSEDQTSSCKKKFSLDKKYYPILLTVGGIKERKGQLDTLKASVLLKEKYPDYLYLIVGSDRDIDYVNKIKKFIKDKHLQDNVKIISNAGTDKDLSYLYEICDIFLMNSNNEGNHFEGFGLVFLEAAQFGKPLIGSKDCGIEDSIEDGYNGYLTRQKDIKGIYDTIMKILNSEIDFNFNSKNFYKRFSRKKTASKYSKEY